MGFTVKQQKKVIEVIEAWLKDHLGDALGDAHFRVGKDAVEYSEYAREDLVWLAIDGSAMYPLLNYGEDGWKFQDKFYNFLTEIGVWYEMNHAWDMNIIPLEDGEDTMQKILDYQTLTV
jgi:hypothetical protein